MARFVCSYLKTKIAHLIDSECRERERINIFVRLFFKYCLRGVSPKEIIAFPLEDKW